uniref:glycoside hydrolase family 16 protein n=2 Tax=Methanomethylovorans sp. TaxID=2758717 RepID=UPI001BD3CE4B
MSAEVISFNPASGTYYPEEAVISSLNFKNTGTENWTFWVGYSVQDSAGEWYDIPPHSVTLAPGETSDTQSKTWQVPSDTLLTTGNFKAAMTVWKTKPEDAAAIRLTNAEKDNSFQIFHFVDDFTSFDINQWSKSSFKMERSFFDPTNVDVKDGNLRIKLPANTLNGGEIESKSLYKYGTYRARMKLPNAPSSITGFFLYMDPDFYSEIDIEVYNDKSGKIEFTTYSEGKKQNFATKSLGFDPTADFHEYRFDFYPGNLSFYVDGKLLQRWTDGMPRNSM